MSYVLTLTGPTQIIDVLTDIDSVLPQVYSGNPNGHLAASRAGLWAYDTANSLPYLSSAGDGTTGGTTWVAQNFVIAYATTGSDGLVRLADNSDTAAGTSTTLVVTPAGAASVYATKGNNVNITQLSGLTTPLSVAQGGTGANTVAGAQANLLPDQSSSADKFMMTDGSGTLSWKYANRKINYVVHTSGGTLLDGSYNICETDSITLNLPASPTLKSVIEFDIGSGITGITIGANGNKIMGSTNDLLVNVAKTKFQLHYTGSTYGWRIF